MATDIRLTMLVPGYLRWRVKVTALYGTSLSEIVRNALDNRKLLGWLDGLILSAYLGLLATLLGYRYGVSDQIEQLPIVMRFLDDSFLRNDFFTNAAASFGPRFFFAKLIAILAGVVPLPWAYLFLTFFSNFSIIAITFFCAQDLFDGSRLAGALACCFVIGAAHFTLGNSTRLVTNMLVPSLLARPLILLSLWSAFRRRFQLCAFTAGLGALIHPLLGLEAGAVALLAGAVSGFLVRDQMTDKGKFVINAVAAFAILGLLGSVWMVPYSSSVERIGSAQFIEITAFFRHPHHYVPSSFSKSAYLQAGSFFFVSAVSWYWWRKYYASSVVQVEMVFVLVFAVIVSLICVGGYLFVEIMPSRIWTTAQVFRLLALPTYLGYVLFAGMVAHLMQHGSKPHAYLLLASGLTPWAMGVVTIVRSLESWINRHMPVLKEYTDVGPVLLFMVFCLILLPPARAVVLLFGTSVMAALALLFFPRRLFYGVISIGITLCLLVIPLRENIGSVLGPRFESLLPQVSLQELSNDEVDMAIYARENTPDTGLFLTPPMFGQFRLIADRAIVVDFKAFPFQDKAMVEWQRRLFDSYGIPKSNGFPAVEEMDMKYRGIDRHTIGDLRSQYGISHAVLYRDTPSEFPVLYTNETFKVVDLSAYSTGTDDR